MYSGSNRVVMRRSAGEIAVANGCTVWSSRQAPVLQRQLAPRPRERALLGVEREVAVQAGVVDVVAALGDGCDQRPDAVPKLAQHRASSPRVVIPGSKSSSSGS